MWGSPQSTRRGPCGTLMGMPCAGCGWRLKPFLGFGFSPAAEWWQGLCLGAPVTPGVGGHKPFAGWRVCRNAHRYSGVTDEEDRFAVFRCAGNAVDVGMCEPATRDAGL